MSPRWYAVFLACYTAVVVSVWGAVGTWHPWGRWITVITGAVWAVASSRIADRIVRGGRRG